VQAPGTLLPVGTSSAWSVETLPRRTASSVRGWDRNRFEVDSLRRARVVPVPVLRAMSSSGDRAPFCFHAPASS